MCQSTLREFAFMCEGSGGRSAVIINFKTLSMDLTTSHNHNFRVLNSCYSNGFAHRARELCARLAVHLHVSLDALRVEHVPARQCFHRRAVLQVLLAAGAHAYIGSGFHRAKRSATSDHKME